MGAGRFVGHLESWRSMHEQGLESSSRVGFQRIVDGRESPYVSEVLAAHDDIGVMPVFVHQPERGLGPIEAVVGVGVELANATDIPVDQRPADAGQLFAIDVQIAVVAGRACADGRIPAVALDLVELLGVHEGGHHIAFLDRGTIGPGVELRRPTFDHPWTEYERTEPDEVITRLQGVPIAITNKVLIRAETLDQLPDLQRIAGYP